MLHTAFPAVLSAMCSPPRSTTRSSTGIPVPPLNKHVLKGTTTTPKKGGKAHYTASEAMRFTLARCIALSARAARSRHTIPTSLPDRHVPRHSPLRPAVCSSLNP